MSFFLELTVDSTEAKAEIANVERDWAATSRRVLSGAQKAYDTLRLFSSMAGNTIDATYQLMAEAAFIAAQTAISIATAQSFSPFTVVQAGLGFIAAGALFAKALEIRAKGEEAGQDLDKTILFANLFRIRG